MGHADPAQALLPTWQAQVSESASAVGRVCVQVRLGLEKPSGGASVRYSFEFPDVDPASDLVLTLATGNRKMYEIRPADGLVWGDLLGLQVGSEALQILRLEGAGEEESWSP